MVAHLVVPVSIVVAPWRETLPILIMRLGGMWGMKRMLM